MPRVEIKNKTLKRLRKWSNDDLIGKRGYTIFTVDDAINFLLDTDPSIPIRLTAE